MSNVSPRIRQSTLRANECVGDMSDRQHTPVVDQEHVSYKKIVGRQIKALRLSRGMTQDVLAERCGIFRTYLSRIESGSANPTLVVIEALAGALEVNPSLLFKSSGTTGPV
jgi:DNA-binding XRE family transcriptional regulator